MQQLSHQSYSFDDFTLNVARGCLLRGQQEVKLRPKSFEVLRYLVANSGRLVSKAELMQTVWPESFVTDDSLVQCLIDVRRALGDDAQHYVKTVPRRGYIFTPSVTENGAATPDVIYTEQVEGIRVVIEEKYGQESEDTKNNSSGVSSYLRPSSRRGLSRKVLAISVLLAVLVAAAIALKSSSGPSRPQTIAILPFQLLSQDAGDAYLELGMADALITKLSNIRQVVVRPTSAVRKYAAERPDPVAAGRELQVASVLEGSIQKSGDRIRVTVQLVSVPDGTPLWGEKFDENLTNIFAVQDSISERLTRALTLKLTGDEKMLLTKHHTENAEAYQLYLKGRYHWNKRTPEDIKKGIAQFEQAIALDPNYALAYAGLADCYAVFSSVNGLPSKEAGAQARQAAMKALELDGTLVEAHTTLANLRMYYDWDWSGAESEFKKAIELNPSYATAHHWYSNYLIFMGRADEAFAEIGRAQELDPLSPIINEVVGWHRHLARRYDEAVELQKKALDLEPNFAVAHFGLATTYEQKGMYDRAIEEFKEAVRLSPNDLDNLAGLGHAYAVSGKRAEALQVLGELQARSKLRFVSAFHFAVIYAGLGDKDQALEWLEKAYEEHSWWMPHLKVEPRMDSLRADPRFIDLLRRLRLQ